MQGVPKKQYFLLFAGVMLFVVNVWVARVVFTPRELMVAILDIGQGDAILLRGPTGITMLVDGGPDRSVLRELWAVLPLGRRSIDVIVATHPDSDHIGGLSDVFQNYEVKNFIEPGIPNDTGAAKALVGAVGAEPGVVHFIARRGMRLDLGGGAYADILYPDRDPAKMETNDGSITMRVVYGRTSFMLTGDLTTKIEEWLLVLDKDDGELDVDVLKIGHHGSKYSTSDAWLAALSPIAVAISVGAKNTYRHPAPEVVERITSEGATVYRTDRGGRIVFTSDGSAVSKSNLYLNRTSFLESGVRTVLFD